MRTGGAAVARVATVIAFMVLLAATGTTPSSVQAQVRLAGLWDKPNEACMQSCEALVKRGCFSDLARKNPAADPGSLQDQCDYKYSICLYDCMCENCKYAQPEKTN